MARARSPSSPPADKGPSLALARVRHLIALDAANVVRRLNLRRMEMVSLFSRLRDRTPLLMSIDSWFSSISFGDLALLEPGEQRAVNQFYECLAELRWYLMYTEDMPLQVQRRVDARAGDLEAHHRLLMAVLATPRAKGSVVEVPVVPKTLAKRGRRRSG